MSDVVIDSVRSEPLGFQVIYEPNLEVVEVSSLSVLLLDALFYTRARAT